MEWISVDERLPECETDVLVIAISPSGRRTITTAMYEDGTMPTEDSDWWWDSDMELDYDEETDRYIVPCGWWEHRYYGEDMNYNVSDAVTHWMPIPELPPRE